ncbi:hypothetical protein Lesp02_02940 [Lentzea sp. NBRC 105346]|uniref:hypothetical protein n=1 Tax=Lentzea sp. NBRC 105346 TaxID=3032205 RepID=UPI0024A4FF54|nr:hypothetical protein [Lentzea sp. NBRC 105346]GLZ28104.1 hypothetical protein Lesp02_02940 [Lentzea sp. NBRC 105346]
MSNNEADIIDQIDEVTEPGPDAATWTSEPEAGDAGWMEPEPGKMHALMLWQDGAEIVEINCDDPSSDITELVGDPVAERMPLLTGLTAWVGDNSLTGPPNPGATGFLDELLRDAISGDYAVSDADRDRVTELLAHPDKAPIVHGPCLVTGTDDSGDRAGPLNDAFRHWFARYIQTGVQQRAEEAERVRQALAGLGLNVVAVGVNAIASIAIVRP